MNILAQMFGADANTIAASLISSGAAALMMVTHTQTKEVYKTKNTIGLPKRFLAFSCCTCILLGLTSVFGLVGANWSADGLQWGVIDVVFVTINVALFCSNAYCLKVKKENLKKAEKAGISEAEYYAKVIEPSLRMQMKVPKKNK